MSAPAPSTNAPNNDRAYIHEFIDIRGTNRANYMHHMTANWSPNAQEDRDQLCFGVWAVVGSTGPWPQVCNIWEEPGFDGLARSLADENTGPGLQDPKLEKWWKKASDFRHGGFDRILLPAEWMPTITQSLDSGGRSVASAHETIKCRPGTAGTVLELARDKAMAAYGSVGWQLVGAWRTALRDDDEVILLWNLPDWDAWAAGEKAQDGADIAGWRGAAREYATDWHRILLAAAPLCPWRTGRQPTRDDRIDWQE